LIYFLVCYFFENDVHAADGVLISIPSIDPDDFIPVPLS